MLRVLLALIAFVGPIALLLGDDRADLQSPDERTRYRAARALGASKAVDPGLTAILVDRLREDPAPAVRWAAAGALGKVQPTQKLALAALTEVVSDPDEVIGVRRVAAESLGRIGKGSKRVTEVLEQAGADPTMTAAAVMALVAVGAEDRAKAFLEHRDEKVRAAAASGYLTSGGADVLAVALSNPDADARRLAAAGLLNRDYNRNVWKPAEIEALHKAAADADPKVRYPVTVALTRLKETGPVAAILMEGITSTDEYVRFASAEGLAVAGKEVTKHLPAIVAAIDSATSERTKLGLILAIGEAAEDAKPALPKLYALLKDKTPVVRRTAMQALVKAGAADPAEAVKLAKGFVKDSDADTRTAAAAVINAFGTNATEIAGQLRSTDLTTALNALPTVGRLAPDDAARLVPDMLSIVTRIPPPSKKNVATPNYGSRVADAIAAIGPKAIPATVEGFKSSDARVRQACGMALVKMKLDAAGAVADLRRGLSSTDADVRRSCVTALGNLGYRAREAIPDLLKAMTAHDDISGEIGEALGWIGGVTGDDAKKLFELAKAPAKPNVRFGRIMAVGAAGKDAIPVLDEIEKSLDPKDRLLQGAVKDGRLFANPMLRLAEQLGVVHVGPVPHEGVFNSLRLEMPANHRKNLIFGILKRIDTVPAPTQVELLRCLGWMGPDAAEAMPAVEKLIASPDESVRLAAKKAAKLIRP